MASLPHKKFTHGSQCIQNDSQNQATPIYYRKLELPDFLPKGSLSLFKKLGLSTNFLDEDYKTWPPCKDYCMACKTVNTLTVTNDHAERKVASIEEYNHILIHTEEQA